VIREFVALAGARFFCPNAMIGIGFEQDFDNGLFCCGIYFGHEIVDLLLFDSHGLDIQRGAVDDGACGASGAHGHIEHGVR
jgi:hypothetical protein